VSCRCCRQQGQPCSQLPGWTWYDWPSSIGGDNRFLQHDSGVRAESLREAREKDVLLRAQDPMLYGLHKQGARARD